MKKLNLKDLYRFMNSCEQPPPQWIPSQNDIFFFFEKKLYFPDNELFTKNKIFFLNSFSAEKVTDSLRYKAVNDKLRTSFPQFKIRKKYRGRNKKVSFYRTARPEKIRYGIPYTNEIFDRRPGAYSTHSLPHRSYPKPNVLFRHFQN